MIFELNTNQFYSKLLKIDFDIDSKVLYKTVFGDTYKIGLFKDLLD